MESLSNKIGVGMRHHINVSEMPHRRKKIPGHTVEIDVTVSGPLSHKTGMIIDFTVLKKRVRGLLDGQFDHSTLISPKSIAILEEFKSRGMKVVETTSGSISGLPILIFDTVLRAHLGDDINLQTIRLGNKQAGWSIVNDNGIPRIQQTQNTGKGATWTSDLHFSHRIPKLGKCDGLHGHNWSPKITFNRPLKAEEYERVTKKIEKKFVKMWREKAILQKGDDFGLFLQGNGRSIREIDFIPTTEMISIIMIREIEKILHEDGAGIMLAHFELWETPTNFVTTIS